MTSLAGRVLVGTVALTLTWWVSGSASIMASAGHGSSRSERLAPIGSPSDERIVVSERPTLVSGIKGGRVLPLPRTWDAGVGQARTAFDAIWVRPWRSPVSAIALHLAGRAPPPASET